MDLIIILGNKSVLTYAAGKTWVTVVASLIALSHLTLLGMAHLCQQESYLMPVPFQLIILP